MVALGWGRGCLTGQRHRKLSWMICCSVSCTEWWLYTGIYNWQNSSSPKPKNGAFYCMYSIFPKIYALKPIPKWVQMWNWRVSWMHCQSLACCLHFEAHIWSCWVHPRMGAGLLNPSNKHLSLWFWIWAWSQTSLYPLGKLAFLSHLRAEKLSWSAKCLRAPRWVVKAF